LLKKLAKYTPPATLTSSSPSDEPEDGITLPTATRNYSHNNASREEKVSRPLWSDGFIGGRAVRLGRTPDRTARAVRHPIGRHRTLIVRSAGCRRSDGSRSPACIGRWDADVQIRRQIRRAIAQVTGSRSDGSTDCRSDGSKDSRSDGRRSDGPLIGRPADRTAPISDGQQIGRLTGPDTE
jgi:hypothetical protein